MSDLVGTELVDRVAVITMMSPPANASSLDLIAALDDAVTAALDSGAAVVVFRSGLDRFFAAGADLKLLAEATPTDFHHYLGTLRSFIERLDQLPQPSIAAIDGMALGGGLELALACTLRIASPRAQLGVPEVKLGLIPGAGGTQRLPRLIGRAAAVDLLITGRSIDGNHAFDVGLVDRLVPADDLVDETVQLAQTLANGPKQALSAIMRCVDASTDLPFAAGMDVEADYVEQLFATPDAREGIAAFIEKRTPTFD
ncbi:MAG: enoyl-CoA hydratase-related protein [Ilumatobacteraceae bacterium]